MGADEGRESLGRKQYTCGQLRGHGGLCLQWGRENRKEDGFIPFWAALLYIKSITQGNREKMNFGGSLWFEVHIY